MRTINENGWVHPPQSRFTAINYFLVPQTRDTIHIFVELCVLVKWSVWTMPPKVQKRKRNVLSLDEENIQKGDVVPAWDRFFNSHPAPQTPRLTSRPGTPDDPPPAPLSRDRWDVSLLSRDQSDVSLLSCDQSDVSHLSRGDVTLPSLPSPGRISSHHARAIKQPYEEFAVHVLVGEQVKGLGMPLDHMGRGTSQYKRW